MSTSGITDYSCTELEIIRNAAGDIGVLQDGQTLNASDVVLFRRKLNMLVKQWVAQMDFAPGLKMWTRRRAYLFLQDDQNKYSIGPTGDECASETYASTTLASAASSSTSLTLTSGDGISAADRIGVVSTDGTLTWTTVTSIVGTAAVVGAAITADAGAQVFAYTSKPLRPFEIISGSLRDTEGNDTPIDVNLSLAEYELIPAKKGLGTPSRIYFEAKRTNADVYIDCAPDDLTWVVRLVFLSYVEDTTAQTQEVDFPAEWFRALSAQLAIDACPSFGRPVTPELKLLRDEALHMARNAYASKSVDFYQSEPDCY